MIYYAIAGVENDTPPNHPDVLKFYDRRSAQSFLDMLLRLGCDEYLTCHVEGHTP